MFWEAPVTLPDHFLWGVSTSAFQIEGAFAAAGRQPSTWDAFPAFGGHDASVACDHYHRYREDVDLMRDLGVGAYRFSISWPRVLAGDLAFYDRLVDELLSAGIAPVATLYHWDTPQAVEDDGGWLDRDTAQRFASYAGVVAERLADRVAMWVPVNEPAMVTLLGYATGQHAPGKALLYDALPTAHHLNLGHGLAVQALRAAGVRAVGTANNHTPAWPASEADADAAGAYSDLHNWLYADPVLAGRYPDSLVDRLPVRDGDLDVISAPLDFYGVNYYNPTRLRAPSEGNPLPFELVDIDEYPRTGFGWPVVPAGLTEVVSLLKDRFVDIPPVYVTESGCSYPHTPQDTDRIAYLEGHVDAALAAGVRGYFVWSLIDNFEWDSGYSQRFGLVHVDHGTQQRTPRASYHWYRERIAR
ncbi:glycoside hydrolase family 1 protein [Saccharothrix longispora]|uniref:Beta-glucosidase n=1 Tax=Saccharothrix longispora TaxID=33920 RepID=A0ABU1Q5L3_9PSEU|nr:family 1 glycosylhydrolase [Saccharothrix longispora]MDR6597434.1 beta-glucosidase [Saccharothrix longispora]